MFPKNKQPHGQGGAGVIAIDDSNTYTLPQEGNQAETWQSLSSVLDKLFSKLLQLLSRKEV